jgi:hypothetical protein
LVEKLKEIELSKVEQEPEQLPPTQPQGMPQQAAPSAPMQLPEEQGIGTLPARNMQGMAGGGITGVKSYADGDQVTYQPLQKSDLPGATTPEDIAQYSAQQSAAARLAAEPENEQTNRLYDPFIKKMESKQADIENRKNNNVNMALLQAGLGMMAGTSSHALTNIGAGGQQGLAAYVSGRKAIDDSQDALDHSQFLMAQAKDAALKGNVRDQVALQSAANAQITAHKQLEQSGLQILDTSAAKYGEQKIAQRRAEIEQQNADTQKSKAENEHEFDINHKGPLYDAEAAAALEKANAAKASKLTAEEIKLAKIQTAINNDDTIASMTKSLDKDLANQNIDFGSKEYYQRLDAIHEQKLPYYERWKVEPPRKPSQKFIEPPAPAAKPGLLDRIFGSSPTTPVQVPASNLLPQNPTQTIPGLPGLNTKPNSTGWAIKPLDNQ